MPRFSYYELLIFLPFEMDYRTILRSEFCFRAWQLKFMNSGWYKSLFTYFICP